jgi:predicted transcriptional regulator
MNGGSQASGGAALVGVATKIIQILRRNGSTPVDYLARLVERYPSEVWGDLKKLVDQGIVRITEQSGESIASLK